MKRSSTGVPCMCQLCNGCLVSRHTRRKHTAAYIRQDLTPATSPQLVPLPLCVEDVPVGLNDGEATMGGEDVGGGLGVPVGGEDSRGPLMTVDGEDVGGTLQGLVDGAVAAGGEKVGDVELNTYGDSWLYSSDAATTLLYEGASTTVLHALVKHFHCFSEHPGISKEALSSILSMEQSFLPPGNKLPPTYEAALGIIEPYLVQPVVFEACKNGCIVYRKEHMHLDECPKCDSSRYIQGSKIPVRRFTYLPLKPRLTRFFGTSNLASVLQSHAQLPFSHTISDIHQAKAWKEAYSSTGVFNGDPRGVSLALCTDGVNPFAHNKVSYSMWPIMMTLLNLPRKTRNRFASILLVGIVPANGTLEPQNLNPYLDILVDELLELCDTTLFDAYNSAPFQCKAEILLHVLDYPGIGKVMSVVGSGGYQGCMFCNLEGERDSNLQKTVYLQNRRFLPADSKLRKDTKSFPGKCTEDRLPPEKKTYKEMVPYHKAYDNANNRAHTQAQQVAKSTGCKATYSLMRLPNHDRIAQTLPDAMHTITDSIEKLLYLIVGKSDLRSKGKVTKAEKELERFGLKSSSNIDQFHAPWQLSTSDLKLAEQRLKNIHIPTHLDFKPQFLFSHQTRLKSHDWKQVACTGILKYCLRDMLGQKQRDTLFFFLDTLTLILAESHQTTSIGPLKDRVSTMMALLERDFPISIQDITTHLLHHIVDGLERFGPVYSTWMYCFERFNSWMCRRALNRFRPEATIMETYRIFEWCEFMLLSERVPSSDELEVDKSLTSKTRFLDSTECKLMEPLARKYSLPIHDPMEITLHKKVLRDDPLTGRRVQFSPGLSGVVSTGTSLYGKIDCLFSYGNVHFAFCSTFGASQVLKENGLVFVPDMSSGQKSILPLEKLSRPLVVATGSDDNELWILSA